VAWPTSPGADGGDLDDDDRLFQQGQVIQPVGPPSDSVVGVGGSIARDCCVVHSFNPIHFATFHKDVGDGN